MNCKFCNAELPEEVTLCPQCGQENLEQTLEEETLPEETVELAQEAIAAAEENAEQAPEAALEENLAEVPKQKPKAWLVILAVIGAVALLTVLVGAVIYGVKNMDRTESYTVSDEKAIKARETVVATVGEQELTNSALQVYFWQAVNDFYNSYGAYLDTSVLDLSQPLDQQIYDAENNTTWQQFFLDGALTSWSRYAALCMEGLEEGYELPQDALDYLDTAPEELEETALLYGYASTAEMLEADMGAACDEAGYMSYLYTNLYAGQYLDTKYDALVPSMEEIETYYAEHEAELNEQGIVNDGSITTDVRHILICPQGGTEDADGNTVYSDAEWEACRQKAQQILDQWAAEGATEELFAQLAMEHTEDPGSMSTGGLYTDIYVGEMVEPFENWCFDESRKSGDTGLVQTVYGYHVMYFVDAQEIWIANVRDTIIYERSLELVNAAAEKWPADIHYNKIVMGSTATETTE